MRFLNLWLRIALAWLREGCLVPRLHAEYYCLLQLKICDSDLLADFVDFGANDFPFQILFKKCFKIVFFRFGVEIRFLELQFSTPLRGVLLCFATQLLQIAL